MHRLPYWDPVKHTILGFMHNWIEGVLKNHLRTLWGIGRDEKEEQKLDAVEIDEQWTESDRSDSASELEDLLREAVEHDAAAAWAMNHFPPPPSASPSLSPPSTPPSELSSPITPTQQSFLSEFHDSEDYNHRDPDYIPPLPLESPPFQFTEGQLQAVRGCIRDVTLPTWVQRPPTNLGEPSHGKLKAHEYLTLFICIFPLIIPEFWYSPDSSDLDRRHLECFHHLLSATNIIASFKTSNAQADAYTTHYIHYRAAIQQLFPHFQSKPNHHFAMHNGDKLKYWGPLAALSEFLGERINGMLQDISTNERPSKLVLSSKIHF
jgi:hypothetical protein